MNYMQQQYPMQQQSIYGQGQARYPAYSPSQAMNNRVRPVSSIEEVKASAIDFDGSVFYFPDLGNKKIYTKQINLDGTASILMYELKEMPIQSFESTINTADFITREEFEHALRQIESSLLSVVTPKVEKQKEQPGAVVDF